MVRTLGAHSVVVDATKHCALTCGQNVKNSSGSGEKNVVGIRREDKNMWERRAPLAPCHVQKLIRMGIRVVVQPSNSRVFSDKSYLAAGAEINDDLSECGTILAVKEVPAELLIPRRNYAFFSHTIKAQPAGMPLLDAILEKKIRLVDYEGIVENKKRQVAFGDFAGNAGTICFLRGIGERLLGLGFQTPFLHVGSSYMYRSLEEACDAIRRVGQTISSDGLPAELCPFTITVTGRGRVSDGVMEILKLLPHHIVEDAEELKRICSHQQPVSAQHVYIVIAEHKDMVRHKGGNEFVKEDYYTNPQNYESIFQDAFLPYSTAIVNGMYWEPRFPKLFTSDDLREKVNVGQDKLLGVCDITCDADGSVPTKRFSSIEKPFYLYDGIADEVREDMEGPGVLFTAVDHYPSELPREATEHFGACLVPLLPALLATNAPDEPLSSCEDTAKFSEALRVAIVTEGGELTDKYKYIMDLRAANEQ